MEERRTTLGNTVTETGFTAVARNDLRQLKSRFDSAMERYESLRAASDSAISRWVWATAPRYHLDPLHFLDPNNIPGTVMESEPLEKNGRVAYGFSKDGRLMCERRYLSDLHDRFYPTFYCHAHERIVAYHFHHALNEGCINCAQLVFSAGSVSYFQQWAIRGWATRTYVCLDGKIRAFGEVFKQDDDRPQRMSGELRYPQRDCVELWTKWPGERRAELTFRGTPPAENPFVEGA